jgi:hypothetical protein
MRHRYEEWDGRRAQEWVSDFMAEGGIGRCVPSSEYFPNSILTYNQQRRQARSRFPAGILEPQHGDLSEPITSLPDNYQEYL